MLYIVIIVFYMKVDLIINDNKHELMIIKELFEGPVGDYGIARNTIKCLLYMGNKELVIKLRFITLFLHLPLGACYGMQCQHTAKGSKDKWI